MQDYYSEWSYQKMQLDNFEIIKHLEKEMKFYFEEKIKYETEIKMLREKNEKLEIENQQLKQKINNN